MSDDTGRLVANVSAGDRAALDALLVRYLPELHAFVRLRAGGALLGREDGEDLVQSVCREVLQDLDDFEYRGERAFKKWLFLAAQNKLRDRGRHWRSQRRDIQRERPCRTSVEYFSGYTSLLSPSRAAIAREEVDALERAFDAMPAEYVQVITLAKILGLGHEQIAAEIGRSPGATRMLLHRALARLAVRLTPRST
jgi:RNA polymerase sigma-70 factor (ECF subfamily)